MARSSQRERRRKTAEQANTTGSEGCATRSHRNEMEGRKRVLTVKPGAHATLGLLVAPVRSINFEF